MGTGNAVGFREVVADGLRIINELSSTRPLDIQVSSFGRSAQNKHGAGLIFLADQRDDLRSWPGEINAVDLDLLGKLRIKMKQALKDGAGWAVIRSALSIVKTR